MVAQREFYVCPVCGNIVEVIKGSAPTPSCCGKEMTKLEAKTADFATEKHVPYIEKQKDGVLVKVGKETAHPMEPDHYIVLIEICIGEGTHMQKFLKPGDKPEAFFAVDPAKVICAREVCNKHGLWKSS